VGFSSLPDFLSSSGFGTGSTQHRSVRRLPVTASIPSSPILVALMMEALSSSLRSVRRLPVTASVPSSPILVALMMEALSFSLSSVRRLLLRLTFLVHRFLSP
jgi:hypothetical protein